MNLSSKSIIVCKVSPKISRRKNGANRENKIPVVSIGLNRSPRMEEKEICCKSTALGQLEKKTLRRKRKRRLCESRIGHANSEDVIVLSDGETDAKEKTDQSTGRRLLRRSFRLHNMTKQNVTSERNISAATSIDAFSTAAVANIADTTCLILSDTDDNGVQDNVNILDGSIGETEAVEGPHSNGTSSDVVILWSSDNQYTASQRRTGCVDKANERLYMVDVTPDPTNLNCLKSDDEPLAKRRKTDSNALIENLSLNRSDQRTRSKRRLCKQLPLQSQHAYTDEDCRGRNSYDAVCRNVDETSVPAQSRLLNAVSSVNENYNVHCLRSNVTTDASGLREIIVDGSNIAMAHTNGKTFSQYGIKLVVDYFLQRGHSVKVFVPQYRRSLRHQYLEELYSKGIIVFTPSRRIAGKKIVPYDDRFILQYATMRQGVVVSCDQYRDLYTEKPEWRDTIEKRLLAPTFVDDYVMFPEDPLGRHGPKLDTFLRH